MEGSYFDTENRIIRNTIDCVVEWRYLKKRSKHLIQDGASDRTPQKNLTIIRN